MTSNMARTGAGTRMTDDILSDGLAAEKSSFAPGAFVPGAIASAGTPTGAFRSGETIFDGGLLGWIAAAARTGLGTSYAPKPVIGGANSTGSPAAPIAAVGGVTDPEAANQWHLAKLGGIEKVWADYTGRGVAVGVYDSGVQYTHPDLDRNYDASRHIVIDGKTYDGAYKPQSGPHGTSVAGIIAAERNGVGTVGIAYDAGLTGVNIFDPYSGGGRDPGIFINSGELERFVAAIRASSGFDVVNHSWGAVGTTFGTGFSRTQEGSFSYDMAQALGYAAQVGRGGLGTVSVSAAGNVNVDGQGDPWHSDRHDIAVSAYRELDGNASSYSARGAHLLVAAPSSDYLDLGGSGIVATDLRGADGYNTYDDPGGDRDHTDQFGGTSAAAPVVTGVVALMLDANENLGWRDVKDILAASANAPVPLASGPTDYVFDNGFSVRLNESTFKMAGQDANWNGGAMHYSTDYGYGAVNAFSAVRMAEVWSLFGPAQTSANERRIETATFDVGLTSVGDRYSPSEEAFTGFRGTPTVYQFNVSGALDVDHIDLTVTYSSGYKYDGGEGYYSASGLQMRLVAPDGTEAFIDTQNAQVANTDQFNTFTFGLAGFRGVDVAGTWRFEFLNPDQYSFTTISSLQMTAFGGEQRTGDVFTYTDEFFAMTALAGQGARRTLSDTDGGTDWINAAAVTKDVAVSLVDGHWMNFAGINAVRIAKGTQIENIVTGDGNDTVGGNALDNEIRGMRGNDDMFGAAGNDRLYGGSGDDRLDGGTGADLLDGGAGNDTYVVDNAGDSVVEGANGGTDTIYAGITHTLTANVESLYLFGNARVGTGNALDNGLFGTNFGDTLYGLDGNDLLKGWGGDDKLYGGAGKDRLEGAEGDDWLDGGAGADTMEGGIGNDTYVVDNAGDTVTEWFTNGAGGTDTVYASINWVLGNNFENLFLTGSANLNATGNASNNVLRGNAGANVVTGGAGNDTLIGLGGNDTLVGGAGADTFVFGAGFGKDTIRDFGAGDVIDLSSYQIDTPPIVIDRGADTLIDMGSGNTILLLGIDPDQLTFTGGAFGFAG